MPRSRLTPTPAGCRQSKWGDLIPRVVEVKGNRSAIDHWSIYGEVSDHDICNCPALMGEPFPTFPKRWEEVPETAYDPAAPV